MTQFGRQLRFLASGLINTTVDFTVFAVLLALAGITAFQANLSAFAAAVGCSYLLNRFWSFADRPGGSPVAFALWMSAIALLSSWGLAWLLAVGLHVVTAKIAVTALVMMLSYTVMNRLIFRAERARLALFAGLAAVLAAGGLLLALPPQAGDGQRASLRWGSPASQHSQSPTPASGPARDHTHPRFELRSERLADPGHGVPGSATMICSAAVIRDHDAVAAIHHSVAVAHRADPVLAVRLRCAGTVAGRCGDVLGRCAGTSTALHLNHHGHYLVALAHYASLCQRSLQDLPQQLLRADGTAAAALTAGLAGETQRLVGRS